ADRRLNVVAVSDEPSVRALAISAGLPAYDTVANGEHALATFREQDRRLAERLGDVPPGESAAAQAAGEQSALQQSAIEQAVPWGSNAPPSRKRGDPLETDASATPSVAVDSRGHRENSRRSRIGLGPILTAALVLLLLAGVGYGAYLFVPTASITLTPFTTSLRPQSYSIVADPNVAVMDVVAGVVPAERLEIPLSVTTTFPATGIQAHETRAAGIIRFRSENTLNSVAVAAGTIVATADGLEFETLEAANVPVAEFATSTPGTVDVPIRAIRPGTRGNVAAGTITVVPALLGGQLVSAQNPDPTDGGRRIEERMISDLDYEAAVEVLHDQLESSLAAKLQDPDTTPRGLTLFFPSAQTGDEVTTPSAVELVGTLGETFDLTVNSIATVTTVNEALVDELAETRLREGLDPGVVLVNDAVQTTKSEGRVIVETVTYDVTAAASAYTEPDSASLLGAVRGKSIAAATEILSEYGMVEISMWPDFVDRLPDQAARISLAVVVPVATPQGSPSPTP
ncbi:MAG TPA: baseplate J/gp47 family protein, partial [Candidatus Limnocylindrales bacterium]|nr:baseplate J/gp47 family protein [Candidatus Limnocylindrales bacterium]